eukprot:TRINITY_DN90375_c0_g1_i1.p1 TRINITY_DN90375_c0_g1~~TRINITY_DN90375_c0_g1_i1.p1  ORF type:complete len:946 (-),score=170.99 TRINITY_DN90375_c0_g1_i1:225-3062(-)
MGRAGTKQRSAAAESGSAAERVDEVRKIGDQAAENNICSICYDVVKKGRDRVASAHPDTGCSHLFHWHCMQTWLQERPTCPVCIRSLQDGGVFEVFPDGEKVLYNFTPTQITVTVVVNVVLAMSEAAAGGRQGRGGRRRRGQGQQLSPQNAPARISAEGAGGERTPGASRRSQRRGDRTAWDAWNWEDEQSTRWEGQDWEEEDWSWQQGGWDDWTGSDAWAGDWWSSSWQAEQAWAEDGDWSQTWGEARNGSQPSRDAAPQQEALPRTRGERRAAGRDAARGAAARPVWRPRQVPSEATASSSGVAAAGGASPDLPVRAPPTALPPATRLCPSCRHSQAPQADDGAAASGAGDALETMPREEAGLDQTAQEETKTGTSVPDETHVEPAASGSAGGASVEIEKEQEAEAETAAAAAAEGQVVEAAPSESERPIVDSTQPAGLVDGQEAATTEQAEQVAAETEKDSSSSATASKDAVSADREATSSNDAAESAAVVNAAEAAVQADETSRPAEDPSRSSSKEGPQRKPAAVVTPRPEAPVAGDLPLPHRLQRLYPDVSTLPSHVRGGESPGDGLSGVLPAMSSTSQVTSTLPTPPFPLPPRLPGAFSPSSFQPAASQVPSGSRARSSSEPADALRDSGSVRLDRVLQSAIANHCGALGVRGAPSGMNVEPARVIVVLHRGSTLHRNDRDDLHLERMAHDLIEVRPTQVSIDLVTRIRIGLRRQDGGVGILPSMPPSQQPLESPVGSLGNPLPGGLGGRPASPPGRPSRRLMPLGAVRRAGVPLLQHDLLPLPGNSPEGAAAESPTTAFGNMGQHLHVGDANIRSAVRGGLADLISRLLLRQTSPPPLTSTTRVGSSITTFTTLVQAQTHFARDQSGREEDSSSTDALIRGLVAEIVGKLLGQQPPSQSSSGPSRAVVAAAERAAAENQASASTGASSSNASNRRHRQ